MSIRLKTKWADKNRERNPEELAGALAFTVWRIGMEGVLHLENENFQTDTQKQRIDVSSEFAIFLMHVADRMAYDNLTPEERNRFVQALALKLADFAQDNREDVQGPDDYRNAFIELLNTRTEDYADCSYDKESGPGFSMVRTFGDHVATQMGDRDNKWISGYIIDIETPDALKTLKRAIKSLLGWEA